MTLAEKARRLPKCMTQLEVNAWAEEIAAALEFIEKGKHWPGCMWEDYSTALTQCNCDQRTARDGAPNE